MLKIAFDPITANPFRYLYVGDIEESQYTISFEETTKPLEKNFDLSNILKKKVAEFTITSGNVCGKFFIIRNSGGTWADMLAIIEEAIKLCKTNKYHERMLELVVENAVYHARSIGIDYRNFSLEKAYRLKPYEVRYLCEKATKDYEWFKTTLFTVRGVADIWNLMYFGKKEKFRFIHFMDGESARSKLESLDEGAFIVIPSSEAGCISIHYKEFGICKKGIVEDSSNTIRILHSSNELKSVYCIQGELKLVDKSFIKLTKIDQVSKTTHYNTFWKLNGEKEINNPQIEVLYRKKGDEAFSQLFLQKVDYDSLYDGITNATGKSVTQVVELRDDRKILVNRMYRWRGISNIFEYY